MTLTNNQDGEIDECHVSGRDIEDFPGRPTSLPYVVDLEEKLTIKLRRQSAI